MALPKFNQAKTALKTRKWLDTIFGLTVVDDAPRIHEPAVTYALLIFCTAIFLITRGNIPKYAGIWGFSEYTKFEHSGFNLITPFFLHTGWLDLFGNMAYIFVFGERVERAIGSISFGVLILFSNVAAECGHLLVVPNHLSIGANGGVAGLLMFYCLQFRKAKVYYQISYAVKLVFRNFKRSVIEFPALIFVILFFMFQIPGAWVQSAGLSNVDSWGHLGGLVGGYIFWYLWKT